MRHMARTQQTPRTSSYLGTSSCDFQACRLGPDEFHKEIAQAVCPLPLATSLFPCPPFATGFSLTRVPGAVLSDGPLCKSPGFLGQGTPWLGRGDRDPGPLHG